MNGGVMDGEIIGGLINSISRFIHLVACQTTKNASLEDFRKIVGILKLLKPVLDEAIDSELALDEHLMKDLEEFDVAVNEARELIEKGSQRTSKIYNVLQSEPMLLKIQKSALEICNSLSALLQSSPCSAGIQQCMQEFQYADQDPISELINHALKDLKENTIPSLDDVIKIMDTLSLTSNQELLMESIALEKERTRAELKSKTEIVNRINWISVLVTHIRYCMEKLEQFGFINELSVPSHFRCPLSLQLMLDPVILASGQTYERSFIQKWLDNGLRVCPKTCQTLAHTNLIPNYTVKALIANWCEENNIKSTHPYEDFQNRDDLNHSFHRRSTSRSSLECHDRTELQKTKVASRCGQEDCSYSSNHRVVPDKVDLQGDILVDKHSCHSHTESISSVISSVEIMSKFDEKVSLLGDAKHPSSLPLNKESSSPWFCSNQLFGSKNEHANNVTGQSLVQSLKSDDLTTSSHVQTLINDLKSESSDLQIAAASEMRLLAKNNMDNRILIGKCGAIPPLASLLYSKIKKVQENVVTALLNLSINDENKVFIAEAGAIEPLIHVLESGTAEAKENSAATLFSLSVLEEYKARIGRSGAVKALVYLLGSGSLRGKKDAATALFNLSIFHENKVRIVQAGAVKYLVKLMEPSSGMVDKSVALLANLSTIPEGRLAIAQEGGIPLLVEIVETGSQRGKENAASTLFQLCLNNQKFCSLVLQEGAVPPLIALSQFGTPRAKEKAQQILSHFRSQREGAVRKKKS
ncbi:U-box domain-containing protein 3 isoform X1 [Canna indica]|uniref:U-box domain-containing protein 12 n=1 Tax=Canna indica TaxID=4628 RepID=A0AAQ3JXT5_9LILI|nr:U-box domain-containing protein 3 isoform X1 [Canna indica]